MQEHASFRSKTNHCEKQIRLLTDVMEAPCAVQPIPRQTHGPAVYSQPCTLSSCTARRQDVQVVSERQRNASDAPGQTGPQVASTLLCGKYLAFRVRVIDVTNIAAAGAMDIPGQSHTPTPFRLQRLQDGRHHQAEGRGCITSVLFKQELG